MLARRGLRARAVGGRVRRLGAEFLLDAGFTPDLGARPLKRAVERHFLTPLALAIAAHDYPGGDQFLFVRARAAAGWRSTFVDPDADAAAVTPEEPMSPLGLPALARSGRGDERSLQYVLSEARRVSEAVDALAPQKAGALAALGEPTFWETDGRFDVLAKAEYLDRLEAATKTANALAARLERSLPAGGREHRARRPARGAFARARLCAGRARRRYPYQLFVEVRSQGTDTSFARLDRGDVRGVGGCTGNAGRAPGRRARPSHARRLGARILADPSPGGRAARARARVGGRRPLGGPRDGARDRGPPRHVPDAGRIQPRRRRAARARLRARSERRRAALPVRAVAPRPRPARAATGRATSSRSSPASSTSN